MILLEYKRTFFSLTLKIKRQKTRACEIKSYEKGHQKNRKSGTELCYNFLTDQIPTVLENLRNRVSRKTF